MEKQEEKCRETGEDETGGDVLASSCLPGDVRRTWWTKDQPRASFCVTSAPSDCRTCTHPSATTQSITPVRRPVSHTRGRPVSQRAGPSAGCTRGPMRSGGPLV
jgi:hypothetical protein